MNDAVEIIIHDLQDITYRLKSIKCLFIPEGLAENRLLVSLLDTKVTQLSNILLQSSVEL